MTTAAQQMRMTRPTGDGRHPQCPGLVFIEADPHHSMYIVTSPATGGGVLVDEDSLQAMLGDQYDYELNDQFGYVSDEYLEHFPDATH